MNCPAKIIVHHSASPRGTTLDVIRGWHVAKGWKDVGYHFVIEADGAVRYGRKTWTQGAHDGGENTDSLGICVVGNNIEPGLEWAMVQERALVRLIRSLRLVYGPDVLVKMHREDEPESTPTECPGVSDARWREILVAVEAPG